VGLCEDSEAYLLLLKGELQELLRAYKARLKDTSGAYSDVTSGFLWYACIEVLCGSTAAVGIERDIRTRRVKPPALALYVTTNLLDDLLSKYNVS
jgi:hypothetical protein